MLVIDGCCHVITVFAEKKALSWTPTPPVPPSPDRQGSAVCMCVFMCASVCICVCLPPWAHQMTPPFPDAGQRGRQDQNRVSISLGLPRPPLPLWAIKTNM